LIWPSVAGLDMYALSAVFQKDSEVRRRKPPARVRVKSASANKYLEMTCMKNAFTYLSFFFHLSSFFPNLPFRGPGSCYLSVSSSAL